MTQALPHVSLNGSRLIRFLTELSVSDVEVSHKHFTEKLGRLINFSDSITLSEAYGKLSAMEFVAEEVSAEFGKEAAKEEFLRVRAALVQSIIQSFVPDVGPATVKLPFPKTDASSETLRAFEPYHRFYAAHQREIDFKVQSLHLIVRDMASGSSKELAQLAALDSALGEVLSVHIRKLFAVTPKLLGKRFGYLMQEQLLQEQQFQEQLSQEQLFEQQQADDPSLWVKPGGWLDKFYKEMQGMLLAELDVRLQPVLGLVEALNQQVDGNL